MCSRHYKNFRSHGSPYAPVPTRARCSICGELAQARKLCKMHYERFMRHGRIDRPDDAERFFGMVDLRGLAECWPWLGSKVKGYGRFRMVSETVSAYRWAYEWANGPTLPGLHVRHKCDNPECVNPAHLEAGTHADNMHDMIDRGRAGWQKAARAKVLA